MLDGTLIINKPEGWTSHDVVAKLRRILGTKKIGHIGTLDPFATGVLVVCVGKATRLVQFLIGLDKKYLATVRLGFATDTQDYTGKPITPLQSSDGVSLQDIRLTLNEFVGEQFQLPPMFSAKKVDGVVLHKAARAGREVEREPARIQIYAIELVSGESFNENADGTEDFKMRVHCSTGTYIRTLAHDLGKRLSLGAHLAALERTAVGHFDLKDALTLEAVEINKASGTLTLMSLSDSVSHIPRLTVDESVIRYLLNGREVTMESLPEAMRNEAGPEGEKTTVRVCDEQNGLIAICEFDTIRRSLKPRVVFS
jgi:tRNA pseudouridine55 synthase